MITPTIIQPSKSIDIGRIAELWRYRELLYIWVWRDIKVRYRQSVVGIGWAVIQPVVTMVVFTVIFGRLAKLPSDGLPYPIFTFVALLPWLFFQRALTQASTSLVTNQKVLTRIYFPRLIAPIAVILVALVDFLIALVVLFGLMAWFGVFPSISILLAPLFLILCIFTALAVSMWLAAFNIEFRDVQHALPFLAQIWMYATPVVYSISVVPDHWRFIYFLNPMVGVIEGFRWAMLGTDKVPDGTMILLSIGTTLILLVSGLWYFSRCERTLADWI